MFCPHCGTAASDHARYCKGCGMSLDVASVGTTAAATVPPAEAASWAPPPAWVENPLAGPQSPGLVGDNPGAPAPGTTSLDQTAELSWTLGFLILCGVVAVLVGAVVGYLVVQLL